MADMIFFSPNFKQELEQIFETPDLLLKPNLWKSAGEAKFLGIRGPTQAPDLKPRGDVVHLWQERRAGGD